MPPFPLNRKPGDFLDEANFMICTACNSDDLRTERFAVAHIAYTLTLT